jgi:pimeloyl-ACP methyl ester carboxylesterase
MSDSPFEQFFQEEEFTRRQLLARLGLGGAAIALPGVLAVSGTAIGATTSGRCYATGESCSLGVDPDVYRMPLTGEFMQHGSRRICATMNWSAFPPEVFDLDFLRGFWPSLADATQQATEAAAFGFVTTHWGPPDAPPADLDEVATPAAFPDEVFSSLSPRTARVEFEVPKTDFEKLGWVARHLPVSVEPDPAPETPLRLRGWYIKGDGVARSENEIISSGFAQGRASLEHPLVILSSGFPYSIAYDQLVGGIDVGRQLRKTVTYLVAQGFDVLFFDKRGHGYSEGFVDGMGEDVFRALDLLEHGVIVENGIPLRLSVITADDRRLSGEEAAAERLLGSDYTARTKPVVLRGFSYGSSQLQKAMAMNYSDRPVEYRFKRNQSGDVVVDEARTPAGNRRYNFRGIVAISGFQGSLKYETAPYFLALDALASTVGHNGGVLKSAVYESMSHWPAHLGLYATNDFETADGAVDAFNDRLRGIKRIRMVTGYHFGLASEPVDTYFAEESARFAKQVTFELGRLDNGQTTTYAHEVCRAESVMMDPDSQSITDVPSKAIRDANQRVDRVLSKWVTRP